MTHNSKQTLIEQYKVRDNLTSREQERLHECEVSLEVALRQKFGSRLSEIMVRDLVGNFSRDPDVFHYVVTGDITQIDPSNRASFLPIAETKVQGNDLARRNIRFSDAVLRTKLEDDFMQSLSLENRIRHDRDGSLTKRMSAYVETKLDQEV
jgi:hypothetical protein